MLDKSIVLLIILTCAASAGLITWAIIYDPVKFKIRDNVKLLYQNRDLDQIYDTQIKQRAQRIRLGKLKFSDKFESQFAAAGIDMTAAQFAELWAGLIIVPAGIGVLLTRKPLVGIGFMGIGFIGPLMYYMKKKNDRAAKFAKQLADALLTIRNSLRSGFSFQQSMRDVSSNMPDPIASEFKRALVEMDYGVSQEDALMHVYDRTKNEDLRMLISALAISQKTGGNLSDVIDTIANTVRTRIQIRQEVKTLTSQGKMSATIIGLLPIAVGCFLLITNPDYMESMLTDPRGKMMLVAAGIMEIIGFIVMNKITDVKL